MIREVKELKLILWLIRTITKNSMVETPFILVNGTEVVLPIEIEEHTQRVMITQKMPTRPS